MKYIFTYCIFLISLSTVYSAENHSITFDTTNSYFEVKDFEGYTLKGFWEDIKVDSSHISDYGKMAFVGEEKWQEWAIKATDFFTSSEVKYYDESDKMLVTEWINK